MKKKYEIKEDRPLRLIENTYQTRRYEVRISHNSIKSPEVLNLKIENSTEKVGKSTTQKKTKSGKKKEDSLLQESVHLTLQKVQVDDNSIVSPM